MNSVQEERNGASCRSDFDRPSGSRKRRIGSDRGSLQFHKHSLYADGVPTGAETARYSPTANAIAQANAHRKTKHDFGHDRAGTAKLATLEKSVIKDDTLFPGSMVWRPISAATYRVRVTHEMPRDIFDWSVDRARPTSNRYYSIAGTIEALTILAALSQIRRCPPRRSQKHTVSDC